MGGPGANIRHTQRGGDVRAQLAGAPAVAPEQQRLARRLGGH